MVSLYSGRAVLEPPLRSDWLRCPLCRDGCSIPVVPVGGRCARPRGVGASVGAGHVPPVVPKGTRPNASALFQNPRVHSHGHRSRPHYGRDMSLPYKYAASPTPPRGRFSNRPYIGIDVRSGGRQRRDSFAGLRAGTRNVPLRSDWRNPSLATR